jgi:archaemetzincin
MDRLSSFDRKQHIDVDSRGLMARGAVRILLTPLGRIEEDLMTGLVGGLERIFPLRHMITEGIHDIEFAYDPSRRQYSAVELLKELKSFRKEEDAKVLGVTGEDLFVPILTFVYGQAQLEGRCAVVSSSRLAMHRSDRILLLGRLIKEGVHELGHTFGLIHCQNSLCAMSFSFRLSQIDRKESFLCGACQAVLETRLGAGH